MRVLAWGNDPNWTRRALREQLHRLETETGRVEPIPHAFDTDALIERALARLRTMRARPSPEYFETLSRTASALACAVDRDRGRELFDAGIAEARDAGVKAGLRFGLAHTVHYPLNALREAGAELDTAIREAGRNWELASLAQVLRGDVARLSMDLPVAVSVLESALSLGIKRHRLHALYFLSIVEHFRGDDDAAMKLAVACDTLPADTPHRRSAATFRGQRANVHLARREYDAGLALLLEVRSLQLETFDVRRLGGTWSNVAVALAEKGDLAAAGDAAVEAIRHHVWAGQTVEPGRAYHNLGLILALRDEAPLAIAALEAAADIGRTYGVPDTEIGALTAMLELVERRPEIELPVSRVVARVAERLEAVGGRVSAPRLASYAKAVSALVVRGTGQHPAAPSGSEPRLSTEPARDELARRVGDLSVAPFEEMLTRRLDELPLVKSPPASDIARFLLLYVGDFLRVRDYRSEFDLPANRAQRHLSALCDAGVLHLEGSRKGARYALAFAREGVPASLGLA